MRRAAKRGKGAAKPQARRAEVRPSGLVKNFPPQLWPSEKVIDRVLAKINARHVPAGLDRTQLRRDLHDFRHDYLLEKANTRKQQSKRAALKKRLIRDSRALFELLAQPQDILLDLDLWPLGSISRAQLLTGLYELNQAADGVQIPTAATGLKSWVVDNLVTIYEKHIGEARASRPSEAAESRPITGPFPRFVNCVTEEIGVAVSSESIRPRLKRRRKR